jgi:spoIIIJ-associated protein
MSSEVEFTAKTVAQAVADACQQLDIKENNLNYRVVNEGASGIFGLVGAKKAIIAVPVPQTPAAAEADGLESDPEAGGDLQTHAGDTTGELSPAATAGKEALERIAGGITPDAGVRVRKTGKQIAYEITSERPGVLIGKRGQTLEAIQYLVEKVANRNSRERVRVAIDIGGYLERKRQNLESLAERTAKKAKKNGKPATVGQLNAHDRRIVHLALKDDGGVTTKSVGRGYMRKLVVLPKKRHHERRKQS